MGIHLVRGDRTCTHCGYAMYECTCGKKRNTSGDVVAYQNYTDYRGFSDYATTKRITHEEAKQKYMEELNPLDNERLDAFFLRTSKHIQQLNEYSSQHHLVGTKKGAWQCHTSSRYCFICVQIQLTNLLQSIIDTLPVIVDFKEISFKTNIDDDGIYHYHLQTPS